MLKAFVAGWPVAHSLSPDLHGFWLKKYKIVGSYERVGVEPMDFAHFVESFADKGFVGGNVTLPHKEVAFTLCDSLDGEANAIGAVNTLWRENGKTCGSCTDSYGFSSNLDDYSENWRLAGTALVLGAGGAARAVIHALLIAGFDQVQIANRSLARAQELAQLYGKKVSAHPFDQAEILAEGARLIVNTTSLGMEGTDGKTISLKNAPSNAIVTDIVYAPLVTPFLAQAQARGLTIIDGLGMLLHQAVPGFERLFGLRPQVDAELRNHLLDVLAKRNAQK